MTSPSFVPSQRPFSLPREARIQPSSEFASIRERGRRLVRGCLIANWVRLPADEQSRVGVVTGRRIGRAVQRSRARRLLREVFRLHQYDLRAPVALVLVARASIVGQPRRIVEQDFLKALRDGGLVGETPRAVRPDSP